MSPAYLAIVKSIVDKKLFTLEEVRAHTKASSSCGSCTGLVENLLAATLGGDYSTAPKKKPICPCTEHTHDDVRQAIRAGRTIVLTERAIVTPAARDLGEQHKVFSVAPWKG